MITIQGTPCYCVMLKSKYNCTLISKFQELTNLHELSIHGSFVHYGNIIHLLINVCESVYMAHKKIPFQVNNYQVF